MSKDIVKDGQLARQKILKDLASFKGTTKESKRNHIYTGKNKLLEIEKLKGK